MTCATGWSSRRPPTVVEEVVVFPLGFCAGTEGASLRAASRSFTFSTFPSAFLGSAPTTCTFLGTMKRAMRLRQNASMSSSLSSAALFLGTTKAHGVSPQRGCGMATTAASATAGWRNSTSSTSLLHIFSPPLMMTSLDRSLISMYPSWCTTPTSPEGVVVRLRVVEVALHDAAASEDNR
ncbi:hypothetical protein BDA96_01G544900 [Sorghum bicolor]|uniref:Uncharacterized protein n=2 Tax=Sorghum bicolor TaxID=4558 RepID=A0A921V499_SORBI|nr:hypothetical protein BDA96_01G544900 [Sorghum bicolor]KXG40215.1 hypothetical protein SORBI_3001G510100 [Sorghum bicolor]